jgi:xyloglucan-specific exo-beta-1,4-glucanase
MVATWNRWYPSDTIFRSTDGGTSWTSVAGDSVRDGSAIAVRRGGRATRSGTGFRRSKSIPSIPNRALYTTGATVWATGDLTNSPTPGRRRTWTVGANGIEETAVLTLASPPAGAHLLSGVGDVCGYRHDDFHVSQTAVPRTRGCRRSGRWTSPKSNALVRRRASDCSTTTATRRARIRWTRGPPGTQFGGNAAGSAGIPGNPYSDMIAVSADGKTLLWAPNAAPPSYSRDWGATWTASTGAVGGLFIASDRANSSKFYGFDGATGTVYSSTDGGATFAAAATLPPDAGSTITNEARPRSVPGREGDVWLALASGLYHSTDSAASFARVATVESASLVGFGSPAPNAKYPAVYLVGKAGEIYGIFRSDDGGATWTRINDGNHQFGMLSAITGDPRIYGRVYLGTSGRGILYGDSTRRNEHLPR